MISTQLVSITFILLCISINLIHCHKILPKNSTELKRNPKVDSLFEDFLLNFQGPKLQTDFYTLLAYYLFVQEIQRLSRQPSTVANDGLPCGTFTSAQLNDEFIIESPNFRRMGEYPNSFTCTWRFKFPRCSMMVFCPTFRLNDFLCLDHFEIKDSSGRIERFCGQNGPSVKLKSAAEFTFRTSAFFSSVGFRCNLRCVEPDPLPPLNNVPTINCACGERSQDFKIVNGQETEIGEFPWMALLVTVGLRRPFCGGTVINDRYILTAAHCVRSPREIILNEHNIGTISENARKTLKIKKIIQHELFNSTTMDFDIAVIKLVEPIDFTNSRIVPVCLPRDRSENYIGNRGTITGWGLASEDAPDPSSTLQKANVTVVTNEKCGQVYIGRPDPVLITSRMMCTLEPGRDACLHDSGGPLIVNKQLKSSKEGPKISTKIPQFPNNCISRHTKYTQIGVISFGDGCARPGIPAVYSRLTEYMDWILKVTSDGAFCRF